MLSLSRGGTRSVVMGGCGSEDIQSEHHDRFSHPSYRVFQNSHCMKVAYVRYSYIGPLSRKKNANMLFRGSFVLSCLGSKSFSLAWFFSWLLSKICSTRVGDHLPGAQPPTKNTNKIHTGFVHTYYFVCQLRLFSSATTTRSSLLFERTTNSKYYPC